MQGLQFQTATAPVRSDPARADIACFVGFVAPRQRGAAQRARLEGALRALGWNGPSLPSASRVLPDSVLPSGDTPGAFPHWLESQGWRPDSNAVAAVDLFRRAAADALTGAVVDWWVDNGWLSPFSARSAADLLELADVPVPIDTWDAFDALFAWDRRPLVEGRLADTTLGAAIRRFFLHGGRKCYVVRVDDPWPLFIDATGRANNRARLFRTTPEPTPADRSSWRGVGHVLGLTDVSFLCIPDLPDLFAVDSPAIAPERAVEGEERFVECADRTALPTSRTLRAFPAPRCDEGGFQNWASFVVSIGSFLERRAREIQFIAALPLGSAPTVSSPVAQWDAAASIQTAFVQLVYPWLLTPESSLLPGAVEPPDAMLAGLLANNALTLGTWRTAARDAVSGLIGLEPVLATSQLERPLSYRGPVGERRLARTLRERISVFTPTATGFQLLSDVTTDDDEAYRPANVNRLIASIARAARLLGEDIVYMNNGEAVWRRLQSALEELFLGLWGEGALAGGSSSEAFEVRCDRSTITQADLDAGRVIARVQFLAASPVERITVVFAMDEGGQVSLLTPLAAAPLEASA